jgi:hypothetical protein
LAGQLAINVHLRKCHHAAEVEVDSWLDASETRLRVLDGRTYLKRLAIPADALPGKLACVPVDVWIERACDRPIVRQADRLPRRIVEIRGFRTGRIALGEFPVGVKRRHLPTV